jgi:hypothetical protein
LLRTASTAIILFQDIRAHPKELSKPQQRLRFRTFTVQWRTMEAKSRRGYFWGYLILDLGVHCPKLGFGGISVAITDIEIKRAKPEQKSYRLSDSGGLHLVISPAGGKLWRWKYRFEGKEKLMALGKYPQVPLAMARERHSEGRRLLATGVDPMAERKAKKTPSWFCAKTHSQRWQTSGLNTGRTIRACAMWTRLGEGSILIFCPAWARSKSQRSKPPILSLWFEPLRRGERGISQSALLRQRGKFFAMQSLTATQGATRPRRFDRVTLSASISLN